MVKVRINDLARELEVKSKTILDALTAVGVTEHKTHSSAVDEEIAVKVRRYLRGESEPPAEPTPPPAVAAPLEPRPVAVAPPPVVEAAPPPPALAAPPVAAPSADAPPPPPPPPPPIREGRPEPRIQVLAPSPVVPAALAPPKMPVAPPRPVYRPPSQVKPATPAPAPTPTPAAPPPAARPPVVRPPVVPPPTPPRIYAAATPPPVPTVRRTPSLNFAPSFAPSAPGAPATAGDPPAAGRRVIVPVAPNRPVYQAPARPLRPTSGQPIAGPAPGRPIYQRPPAPGSRPAPTSRTPAAPEGRRPMHPTRAGGRDLPPRGAHHREPRQKEGPQKFQPSARSLPAAPVAAVSQITISEGVTVAELSERLGLRAGDVIRKLLDRGHLVTVNQSLGIEIATQIAKEFGAEAKTVSFEEEILEKAEPAEAAEAAGKLKGRAPVVTIMGHVDHGKTSLLDAIRETSVAAGEAGGITQHIGAYKVEIADPASPAFGRSLVFIDTPGHAAFTRMRARGARVTDVVVLVVAADDGVMPQTLEAIDHAKAAGVPLLVAINKVDKPDAVPDRVKKQLAERGLQPEDWGGSTVMVNVSAKARTNLNLLLEMILLVSDLQELRADVDRPGQGTVLEAQLDRGRGPVARVLVQNGTIRAGDTLIAGAIMGRVRALFDDRGRPINSAGPSTPVEVLGLESLPDAGDGWLVVNDRNKARQIVQFREEKAREATLARSSRLNLEALSQQLAAGDVKELNLIVKADVQGSEEVLVDSIAKLGNDRVKVRVIHSGVGAITETDVLLASASNAVVIGFNVRPERKATELAEVEKVDVRLHSIIYELTDEIKRAMHGLLEPTLKETVVGRAQVQQTFRIPRVGMIAGCLVRDGRLTRDNQVRVVRDGVVVYTSKLGSLRRFKDDVSEVRAGVECGVQVANFSDVKPGDFIEAFQVEKVAPTAV